MNAARRSHSSRTSWKSCWTVFSKRNAVDEISVPMTEPRGQPSASAKYLCSKPRREPWQMPKRLVVFACVPTQAANDLMSSSGTKEVRLIFCRLALSCRLRYVLYVVRSSLPSAVSTTFLPIGMVRAYFYPPPMQRDDEPFFLNPRLFPEGTRGVAASAAAEVRDAARAWTYSMAQTASYAM